MSASTHTHDDTVTVDRRLRFFGASLLRVDPPPNRRCGPSATVASDWGRVGVAPVDGRARRAVTRPRRWYVRAGTIGGGGGRSGERTRANRSRMSPAGTASQGPAAPQSAHDRRHTQYRVIVRCTVSPSRPSCDNAVCVGRSFISFFFFFVKK